MVAPSGLRPVFPVLLRGSPARCGPMLLACHRLPASPGGRPGQRRPLVGVPSARRPVLPVLMAGSGVWRGPTLLACLTRLPGFRGGRLGRRRPSGRRPVFPALMAASGVRRGRTLLVCLTRLPGFREGRLGRRPPSGHRPVLLGGSPARCGLMLLVCHRLPASPGGRPGQRRPSGRRALRPVVPSSRARCGRMLRGCLRLLAFHGGRRVRRRPLRERRSAVGTGLGGRCMVGELPRPRRTPRGPWRRTGPVCPGRAASGRTTPTPRSRPAFRSSSLGSCRPPGSGRTSSPSAPGAVPSP